MTKRSKYELRLVVIHPAIEAEQAKRGLKCWSSDQEELLRIRPVDSEHDVVLLRRTKKERHERD